MKLTLEYWFIINGMYVTPHRTMELELDKYKEFSMRAIWQEGVSIPHTAENDIVNFCMKVTDISVGG